MPFAVEFSFFIGVAGWVCPISYKVVRIGSSYRLLCKRDTDSDSMADTIIYFTMLGTVCTATFVSLVF